MSSRKSFPVLVSMLIFGVVQAQPFPSFLLDTVRTIVPVSERPWFNSVSVAFAGSVGLVVWPSGTRVMGCRVDRKLGRLDSVCLDISGTTGYPSGDERAGVASNGSNFLAGWSAGDRENVDHVMATIVSLDGRVQTRLKLAGPCYMVRGTSVSSDGVNYLVAWVEQDARAVVRALFVRVSGDGRVLDPEPRPVCPVFSGGQSRLDVAFGDSCYLAVWAQSRMPGVTPFLEHTVWASRIRPDGTLPDSAGLQVARRTTYPRTPPRPAVTFDGSNFVVAWIHNAPERVVVARVTSAGELLDVEPVLIATPIAGGFSCDVHSSRDTTLVLWCYGTRRVFGRRVDTELRWLDTVPVEFTPTVPRPPWESKTPAAATTDEGFVVSWVTHVDNHPEMGSFDIVGRRLSRGGALLDTAPVRFSFAANAQQSGDVASDGTSFLAVWDDYGPKPGPPRAVRVRGTRFTADGQVLDHPAFWVGDSGSHQPAVAFGAGNYLVCWKNYVDTGYVLSAARVSPEGELLDTMPIRVHFGRHVIHEPDVAYADSVFLVTWHAGTVVRGARITPAGVVLDSPPLNLKLGGSQWRIQVASDGHGFLTTRSRGTDPPGDAVLGLRVGVDGVPLEAQEFKILRGAGYHEVAYGAGVYLVYSGARHAYSLVSPEGVVLDTQLPAGPFVASTRMSSVASNGTDFVLVGVTQGRASVPFDRLRCMTISPQRGAIDTPVLLAITPYACLNWASASASDSLGNVAVLFSTYESLNYMACRIRAVVVPGGVGLSRSAGTPAASCPRLRPNPTARFTNVETGSPLAGPVRVEILDVAGRRRRELVVKPQSPPASGLSLDLQGMSPGVYYIRSPAFSDKVRVVVTR